MTEVSNKTFYHINSSASLSPYPAMVIGQRIEIGNDFNPFFNFYNVYRRTYPVRFTDTNSLQDIPSIEYLKRVQSGNINTDFRQLANVAVETADHFQMLSRELFWENIRTNHFPYAPSRQKCMWLIPDLEYAERWRDLVGKQYNETKQLIELKATGIAINVDSCHLDIANSETLPSWEERSHKYWNQEFTETPLIETLFIGKLTVENIIKID